MRVLLSGYYGFGNLGDEALLEVIVTQLRRRFPGITIDVLSSRPEETASAYGVEATPRWNGRAVRAAIAKADAVLSGGGGLLQSATSVRSAYYYAAILREAVKQRRRSMIFAQSIGPLDALGRFIVKRFCRGVDRATVRDARSVQLLQTLLPGTPVEQTADPVFLYDLPVDEIDLQAEGLAPEPYAIISVRKIPALKEGTAALVRAVDALYDRHGIRSAFLPLGGVSDAEVSTNVIRACSSAPMLLPECSLARAAAVIKGRARRHRHAPARTDSRRALRRAVSGDPLRSEGRFAVRGPGLSARSVVDSGAWRAVAGRRGCARRPAVSRNATSFRRFSQRPSSRSAHRRHETSMSLANCWASHERNRRTRLPRYLTFAQNGVPDEGRAAQARAGSRCVVDRATNLCQASGTQSQERSMDARTTVRRTPTASCTWGTS